MHLTRQLCTKESSQLVPLIFAVLSDAVPQLCSSLMLVLSTVNQFIPTLYFQRVPGVLMTEVGYSNGQQENPTYEDVCSGQSGHAEVVRVVYDPTQVRLVGCFAAVAFDSLSCVKQS